METRFGNSFRRRSLGSRKGGPSRSIMTSTSLTFGPFRLIPGKRLLLRSNQPVRLPRKAYEILLLLLERSGQIVLKRELIERVTSGAPIGESQIRVYISKLRRALEDGQKGMRYVENVNSHGYRFIAPVTRAEEHRKPLGDDAQSARALLAYAMTETTDPLDLVMGLVCKSLVTAKTAGENPRFRLLDTALLRRGETQSCGRRPRDPTSAGRAAVRMIASASFEFGPFELIPNRRLLLRAGGPVNVPSRAWEILLALIERAGQLVGKAELLARVWPRTVVEEGALRVHIAGLRKILGDRQDGLRYIENVTGQGYRFVAAVCQREVRRALLVVRPGPEAVCAAETDSALRSTVLALTSTLCADLKRRGVHR